MGETEKPFACTSEGCEMKFTNEDHLNVHRKRHMVLNLGLATKNVDVADQTPTPTRFIRNCEEVGLFQDLQNVNPFEETFKKAIENGKCGSLHVPEASTDDTLHTPHIFPHIEGESTVKFIDDHEVENQSNLEFAINNEPAIDTDILKLEKVKIHNDTPSINSLLNGKDNDNLQTKISEKTENKKIKLDMPKRENAKSNIKQRIKAAIRNKMENDFSGEKRMNKDVPTIKVTYVQVDGNASKTRQIKTVSEKASLATSNNSLKINKNVKPKLYSEMSDLEKRRALNRAAQLRSRARKKMRVKQMETEMDKLKTDNKDLLTKYDILKNENAALKMILLQHANCSIAHDPVIIEQTQKILNSPQLPKVQPKTCVQKTIRKKQEPVLPITPTTSLQKVIELPIVLTTIPALQATHVSKTLLNNDKVNSVNLTALYPSNMQKTATNIISAELIHQLNLNNH